MNCRQGMENYCQTPGKPSPGGLGGTDGGMAEYLLVPSTRYLIPLGDLDPREAAPLTDAGLTSYHAVKRSVHLLGPGSTAVVIGAGGSGADGDPGAQSPLLGDNRCGGGHFGRQTEDRQGDGRRRGVALRRRCGQTHQGHDPGSGRRGRSRLRRRQPDSQMAARVARVLGHLTIVGVGNAALPVNFSSPPNECAVSSPFWGTIPELIEVINLAQAGKVKMLVEHFTRPAGEAYDRLHHGTIQGRAVITPNS